MFWKERECLHKPRSHKGDRPSWPGTLLDSCPSFPSSSEVRFSDPEAPPINIRQHIFAPHLCSAVRASVILSAPNENNLALLVARGTSLPRQLFKDAKY